MLIVTEAARAAARLSAVLPTKPKPKNGGALGHSASCPNSANIEVVAFGYSNCSNSSQRRIASQDCGYMVKSFSSVVLWTKPIVLPDTSLPQLLEAGIMGHPYHIQKRAVPYPTVADAY
jgi:hypothetical protein